MTGAELIAQERKRQQDEEGYDERHDDHHRLGELVHAAICYAAEAVGEDVYFAHSSGLPFLQDEPETVGGHYDPFPWHKKDDKRGKHDRKKLLVIAGALIAAELDRMERASEMMEKELEYDEDPMWDDEGLL